MILVTGVVPAIENPQPLHVMQILEFLPYLRAERNYLILECGDSYLQGRPELIAYGVFRVEYRDADVGRHYLCWLDSAEEALPLFVSYLEQDGLWRNLVEWKDISHAFRDLNVRTEIPLECEFFTNEAWERRKATQEKWMKAWENIADDMAVHKVKTR